jgi:hypothetical protein
MDSRQFAKILTRQVQFVQGAARAGSERPALRRERHMTRRPVHQSNADLPFQLADVCADRRLRQSQALGRPPETLSFRETHKG